MSSATQAKALVVGAAALVTVALCLPMSAAADSAVPQGGAKSSSARHGMQTAPQKSNGSGVTVKFRVDPAVQAGGATTVVLTFDGVADPAGAVVRLAADGGLTLGRSGATSTLPAGVATTLAVEVVPPASGIGYLNVFTTQYGATSATSIPVQTGKAPSAMPASGDLKQSPDGEKIRPMQVK